MPLILGTGSYCCNRNSDRNNNKRRQGERILGPALLFPSLPISSLSPGKLLTTSTRMSPEVLSLNTSLKIPMEFLSISGTVECSGGQPTGMVNSTHERRNHSISSTHTVPPLLLEFLLLTDSSVPRGVPPSCTHSTKSIYSFHHPKTLYLSLYFHQHCLHPSSLPFIESLLSLLLTCGILPVQSIIHATG